MKENLADYKQPAVFDILLKPVRQIVDDHASQLVPHHNEKFSFPEFFRLLIYYFVSGAPSAKLLINTLLKKGLLPSELNLPKVPYTTSDDAFGRFSPDIFKAVFITLLSSLSLHPVPELSALGVSYCVDGSLFPTLNSMDWASYKKNCNAVRLHLCFGPDRMIPTDIIIGSGNSSERDALRQMPEPVPLILRIAVMPVPRCFMILSGLRLILLSGSEQTGYIPLCNPLPSGYRIPSQLCSPG